MRKGLLLERQQVFSDSIFLLFLDPKHSIALADDYILDARVSLDQDPGYIIPCKPTSKNVSIKLIPLHSVSQEFQCFFPLSTGRRDILLSFNNEIFSTSISRTNGSYLITMNTMDSNQNQKMPTIGFMIANQEGPKGAQYAYMTAVCFLSTNLRFNILLMEF